MTVDEAKLRSKADPRVWAEEFMKEFGNRKKDIDEGLMIGWFANAMEVGRLSPEPATQPTITFDELVQYTKYRITYQDPTQRLPRQFVGTFLGYRWGAHSRNLATFSLRPVAGTTDLPQSWFLSAEKTNDEHRQPRKVAPRS